MIYATAALDSKRGIATDAGIPWDLPTDKTHFRRMTSGSPILMGYHMYTELGQPLPDRRNLVITHPGTQLKAGFEAVEDAPAFLKPYRQSPEILWVVGGAKVYERLLAETQKLYLTRIEADFNCTKFFPAFEDKFELIEQSDKQTENNLTFYFETWQPKPSA